MGVADPGNGGAWEWRNLGVWRTLEVANPGSRGSWELRILEMASRPPSPSLSLSFSYSLMDGPLAKAT